MVGIGIFVFNKGELLLLKRAPTKDGGQVWGLPGGKTERGERWEECAARELKEEVGLDCSEFKQLGWVNYLSEKGENWITLFVYAIDPTGEPKNLEPDAHTNMGFFPISALPSPLFTPLKTFIEQHPFAKD